MLLYLSSTGYSVGALYIYIYFKQYITYKILKVTVNDVLMQGVPEILWSVEKVKNKLCNLWVKVMMLSGHAGCCALK